MRNANLISNLLPRRLLADLGILVGILTGLLSALVNLVYTWRKDRREQRASDAAWATKQKED